MDLWKSRAYSIVDRSIQAAMSNLDKNRVADAVRALEYFRDINYQKHDLYLQFMSEYADAMAWEKRPKAVYNLTDAVSSVLATLYHDPVRRTFEEESHATMWEEVDGFDSMMQDVDLYTSLTGTVVVRPVWKDKIEGENEPGIKFAVYTADKVEITPKADDPTVPDVVMMEWGTGESKVTHIWTAEKFVEAVNEVVMVEAANPYGFIPVVVFTNRNVLNGIFDEPARDLVHANLTLNKMVTDLNYTVTFQTHGQLVIKGAPTGFAPKVGPSSYLAIPAGADSDAKFITPGADIDKAINAINLNLKMFMVSRRIPEDTIIAQAQGQSGVSIVAKQAALGDYRKRRVNAFRAKEQRLIAMTLAIMGVHTGKSAQQFSDIEVTLDYKELKAPMDMAEQQEWTWKFQNKIATPIDYMMSSNPDLSEEEAKKKYEENAKFAQKQAVDNMKTMLQAGGPGAALLAKPGEKPAVPGDKDVDDK